MKRIFFTQKIKRALRTKSGGQGLMEFALVLPIFLWLTIGIVDLGRGIADYSVLSNAAHEGARAGIFASASDLAIQTAVNSETALLGTIPNGDITIAPAFPRTTGGTITVTVTYTFHPLTPILSNLIGSGIVMTATSTMPVE